MVRLRQMEIPGWWCGYAEWKSRIAWCGYVKWRSPARQPAATRLGTGRRLRTVTTSPFGKIKMLGPPVPYGLGVKVAISGPDGDCGG